MASRRQFIALHLSGKSFAPALVIDRARHVDKVLMPRHLSQAAKLLACKDLQAAAAISDGTNLKMNADSRFGRRNPWA